MRRKTPALRKRMPSFQCFFQNNTGTIVEGGERRLIAESNSNGNGMKKKGKDRKLNIDLQQTDDVSKVLRDKSLSV